MDAEINTNVSMFGANLVGYPHINEGSGNYVSTFSVDNEKQKTNYQHMPTDDLSHIWATNHRDNIDDMDAVLREANVNALDDVNNYDVDFHGARDLNVVATASQDMWNFDKYLNVDEPFNPTLQGFRDLNRKHKEGMDGFRDLNRKHKEGLEESPQEPAPPQESEKSESSVWVVVLIVLAVVLGVVIVAGGVVYFVAAGARTPPAEVVSDIPMAQGSVLTSDV